MLQSVQFHFLICKAAYVSYGRSLGWENSIWASVVVKTEGRWFTLQTQQLSGLRGQHNPHCFPSDFLLATSWPRWSTGSSLGATIPLWAAHGWTRLTPNKASPGVIPPNPLLHPPTRQGKRCQSCHHPPLNVILVMVSLCCYSVLHLAASNLII